MDKMEYIPYVSKLDIRVDSHIVTPSAVTMVSKETKLHTEYGGGKDRHRTMHLASGHEKPSSKVVASQYLMVFIIRSHEHIWLLPRFSQPQGIEHNCGNIFWLNQPIM